ncbi:MAG: MFS transporter [Chloroflexi bacterium]|nr:MFS transporter [Chloroflexota bacterium]
MVALLSMVILVGMGEKLAERFLPIYLIALGGSTLSIGLLNGMDNLLSALYSFPGGYLSDRLGYKRALLVFNLVAIAGYAIVVAFPYWQAVILGSIFFLSWSAISLPATVSLVSDVLPAAQHTMGISMHSLVRRIPMALGPIIGGLLIAKFGQVDGVRIGFAAAIVLALISLAMQQFMLVEKKAPAAPADKNPFRVYRAMSFHLKRLLVADVLVRFCEQIPYAFVVVWVIQNAGLSALEFGILTSIEMLTAVLIYIPVAYLADRSTKKPFVVATYSFFTLFPLMLLLGSSFAWLVLAFVVRGLKEFGEPNRKALIMDLAPDKLKASSFGAYYMIRDVIVSVAAFGGAFLWNVSPQFNFLIAFGFGVLGTLYFAVFGKDVAPSSSAATPA